MSEPATSIQRTENDQDVAEARANTGMQSTQSKETPVTIPPSITYGLQDTHTTILPVQFYLTAANCREFYAATLRLNLNDLDQRPIVQDTFTTNQATVAANCGTATPVYNFITNWKPADADGALSSEWTPYPITITNGKPTPLWWDYYSKLYSYYTVVGCEYEITFRPIRAEGVKNTNIDVLLIHSIESGGTEGTGVNREPPINTTINDLLSYKQMKHQHIAGSNASCTNSSNIFVLKGYHTTGSTKRDVTNDGDVKTWSKVGGVTAGSPTNTYREYLFLNLFKHPLACSQKYQHVMMDIKLKYVVQFKQLDKVAQYPSASYQYSIVQTLPIDATQTI